MSDVDFAYLAGVIDSDGHITINRSCRKGRVYHGAVVGISGTRRQPHDLAASIWGGNVKRYTPKNPRHRPVFVWSRMGTKAVPILLDVLPYLRIKRPHALLAVECQDHVTMSKFDDPFPWFGPDYDPIAARDEMRLEMVEELNQWRRVGKKKAGRLLDGRTWDEYPGQGS
jgi:hypothetical protein